MADAMFYMLETKVYDCDTSFQARFLKQKKQNECSEVTWSMVELSHENLTDSCHYTYKINKVTAENNYCYHCGQYCNCVIIFVIVYISVITTLGSISFTSEKGGAKITLINATIQAFSLHGTKLSPKSQ